MSTGRKKILVTGATGFVGSRVVRKLVDAGHGVKALCRPGASMRSLADVPRDAYEVAEGDITLQGTVYRALAGCDRMIHTAAVVKMWDRDPSVVLDGSIVGMRETLEAARHRDLEKIVVTSSVATLGTSPTPEPADERKQNNLEDPEQYVRAKIEAEKIALAAADDGMPIVIVLPTAIYGPGDWKPTMSGAGLLEYLNWPWPFRFPCNEGGVSVADVDDVASGHVAALDKGRVGERYLLGGENLTFRAFFETIAQLAGLPGPGADAPRGVAMLAGRVMELGARLFGGEPSLTYRMARDYVGAYQWASSAKAESELGYRHRSARKALARSIRWYVDNGYLTRAARERVHLDLRTA
jgi:dihydroflavonol-4-reductase